MDTSDGQRDIESLVAALADLEAPESELGTPVLVHSRELDELVALGLAALPHLLRLLPDRPAKAAAYIVLAVGMIGDHIALDDVRRLRSRYQALDPKGPWEFAVIGQCNLAIQALEHGGAS